MPFYLAICSALTLNKYFDGLTGHFAGWSQSKSAGVGKQDMKCKFVKDVDKAYLVYY